jgi:hypothetical protein
MEYYITETESEALEQDALDYTKLKELSNGLPLEYWATTTNWAIPKQRLDGKWIRNICHKITTTNRLIESEPNDGTWFVINEI